jgi:peptidoglycan/LPS O-acetylase OafA/YrhL
MMPRPRLDHIHGLRGIAALVVVIQHACQMVQEGGFTLFHPMLDTINLGRFGVVLFFLISGLVIPSSFHGENPLRNFIASRIFRLYPGYWLSIPVLAIVASVKGTQPGLDTVLANLTMLQSYMGQLDIGPGYWTLKFEVLFYFLCAVMFWRKLLADAALNGVLVLAGLLTTLAPFALGDRGFVSEVPYFVAMFFMGMLLRRAFVDHCQVARKWSAVLVSLTVVAGALMGGCLVPVPANSNVYFSPTALGSGMALPVIVFVLVLWLKPTPPRAAMYLGSISYSLYLFQDIGLHLLPHLIPPGAQPFLYISAVLVLSVMVAAIVYRFVEQPMIELGKRLTQTRSRRRVVPSPT